MPVPSSITDLSQTAGSNSPAGGDSVFPNLDNYIRAVESFIAVLRDGKGLSAELDVASSGTCDIGASNSPFARITGTTTITSFGTNYNGPRYLRFADALILTHSSTLVLPTSANITTVAGDSCVVVPGATSGTSDKWVVVAYQRASGEFLTAVTRAQLQAQTYTAFTTAGTSSAFTLTPVPAITAYAENQEFDVEFNAASTGEPTLNISAVGAKFLKFRLPGGTLVTCGTLIPSGWRSKVTYDGTDMIVREMPLSAATPAAGTSAGAAGATGTASDAGHAHPPMSGSVIQVAYAGLTTYTTSTTVMAEGAVPPTNTDGEEELTLAFTPKLATSTLRIRVRGSVIVGGSYRCCAALFVDSTVNALAAHVGTNAPIDIEYYVSAASTSARTYKLRIGPSAAGTIYINGNFGGSIGGLTMSVDEIAA